MRNSQRLRSWFLVVLAVLPFGAVAGLGAGEEGKDDWRAVYTLTNDKEGNELAVFVRDRKGRLAPPIFVATGGEGTGGGLGNQGAIALGDDGDSLYAVNPGSDSISVFRLGRRGPDLIQVIPSGGARPISLAVHRDLLYVLNAGGAVGKVDGIRGFEIRPNGRLRPLAKSGQLLSDIDTAPAQIGFNPGGTVLIVTEQDTNRIGAFALDRRGLPVASGFAPSAGTTPFGFGFSRDGFLIVSEAFGGEADASAVSSYSVDDETGTVDVISESVPTRQTAACWIAITRNGEYAYTTNTGSNSVTGYHLDEDGKLERLDDDGVTAETGAGPTDVATRGDRALFVLNSVDGTVGVYGIEEGGALKPVQLIGGLPLTRPTGLVVR